MQGAFNRIIDAFLNGDKAIWFMVESLQDEVAKFKGELEACKALARGAIVPSEEPSFVSEELQRLRASSMLTRHKGQRVALWSVHAITTSNEVKVELKRQFQPMDAEHKAQAKLRRLQHKDSHIQDYVWEFSELMLEIPNMAPKETFFMFVDKLSCWAKLEL
ncbi:Retrotransposon gag domain [Dillenia turbinata]|uniref:Retrotransposon gag domain n=1 Tax=Dillenia turbinata TaxID=194707 RepID=A0AAN8V8R1_9MAGN